MRGASYSPIGYITALKVPMKYKSYNLVVNKVEVYKTTMSALKNVALKAYTGLEALAHSLFLQEFGQTIPLCFNFLICNSRLMTETSSEFYCGKKQNKTYSPLEHRTQKMLHR